MHTGAPAETLHPPDGSAERRRLKVGVTMQVRGTTSRSVPFIRLSGQWLERAGFSTGAEVQVVVTNGEIRLLCTPPDEPSLPAQLDLL